MMAAWVSESDRAALLADSTERVYKPGALLFREGDPPGWLAIIREGHVKVTSHRPQGGESILSILGPGQLIGELSALDGSPRVASVQALDKVAVGLVTRTAFERFLTSHPRAALALLRTLAERLRQADRLQLEFGSTDALGRVCRRLDELAEANGTHLGAGKIQIDLPITQQELAAWIGSSRESVARALSTLRDRGIVDTARKRIVILDRKRLQDRR